MNMFQKFQPGRKTHLFCQFPLQHIPPKFLLKCTTTEPTRHTASTSMYSLTFCVRVVARTPPVEARSPGRCSNVENAPHQRPAVRADPAERSHYVIISRDGRKLVTRVRVMLPQQHNPCTDCKSTQECTTRAHPLPLPQVTSGSMQQCGHAAADRQTDRHTDARDHNTFCVVYDSRKM